MQIFLAEFVSNSQASLNPTETRHCLKVLRHQPGDLIHCIDGEGTYMKARIESFHSNQTELQVLEVIPNWGEHGGQLTLAVSPLRLKDRFEWLVEKAVELGVNELVPIHCAHTDVYRAKFKPERIRTIMVTALKQCMRSRLPVLHPVQDFDSWLKPLREGTLGFLAQAQANESLQSRLNMAPKHHKIFVLIGPEGDFSREERELATQMGYIPVNLGQNRLRTETAALHALSLIKGAWHH